MSNQLIGHSPRRRRSLIRAAQNAIERRVQQSQEQMGLQQSRLLVRTLTWALISCTGFGVVWLSVAQTEEVVMATGKLEPIGDVTTIQVPMGGVLDQMLVREGQRVGRGQVLLRLDQEATRDREGSLMKTIRAKQQQLRLKEVELQRYLNLNDTEQRVLNQNLSLEREILNRLESLRRVGQQRSCNTCNSATKYGKYKGSWPRYV